MEMGTAINETRDHNGEKHRILIPTDWTFNGKLLESLMESFKRKNKTSAGKFHKREWGLPWKVTKERMRRPL